MRIALVVAFTLAACSSKDQDTASARAELAKLDIKPKNPALRHPDPDGAVKTCLAELRAPAPPGPRAVLPRFAAACKGLFVEAACRDAWDRAAAGPPEAFGATIYLACRDAYCPILPVRPAICDVGDPRKDNAWPQLARAVLAFDLGPARASDLAADMTDAVQHLRTDAITVTPSGLKDPCGDSPPDRTGALAIRVDKDGVWVGDTGGARRFVARCGGDVDGAAVAAELQAIAAASPGMQCRTDVEVAAGGKDIRYQDLVSAMDAALGGGFPDVGLTDPAGLSVTFPDAAADADRAPARCGQPIPKRATMPAVGGAVGAPPMPDVKDVPVLIITPDAVSLRGGKPLMTAKELAAGGAAVARLTRALEAAKPGPSSPSPRDMLVIQADRSLPQAAVDHAVEAAKGAGLDQVLFAVKNK